MKYYFLLPYFKRLKTFFVSDILVALEKDDLFFNRGIVRAGIEFYVKEGSVIVSDSKFFNGGTSVKKYIWRE